ncbi:MAG: TIGR04372 family glycosyltransferase [Candidatus Omnitrophota bacterium]
MSKYDDFLEEECWRREKNKNGCLLAICYFIQWQFRHIRGGGGPELLRKLFILKRVLGNFFCDLTRNIIEFPLIIIAIPFVLGVRLVGPFKLIRFGRLHSLRIGHFAGNVELYLSSRDLYEKDKRSVDVLYHTYPICNQQLKKMWERVLYVMPAAEWLDKANRFLPGGAKHTIKALSTDRDMNGLLALTQNHLSFTSEEEQKGKKELLDLGIAEDIPFVCFAARDSAYMNKANSFFKKGDWAYHDYRNSDIQNYILGVEELVARGYQTVRMGSIVKKRLEINNPNIIDYAVKGRSDFLDIYLGAKCDFFVVDTSGLYAIPFAFRRSMVIVNYIPLEYAHTRGKDYIFIPKKLWLCEERRFLTFQEILNSSVKKFYFSDQYKNAGIEAVENTAEEIKDLIIEMEERLTHKWQTIEEEEELQQRFWDLFPQNEMKGKVRARIGTKFLRQNRSLLF